MKHQDCGSAEQVLQYIGYNTLTIERRPSGFYVRRFLKDLSGSFPTLQTAQLFCKQLG
ncbi:MAG TPA: hypothetical protein VGD78_01820 [Chthoniobacterales bacterium]